MAMLSALALDHVHRRRHSGPLANARYGVSGEPGEGASIEIWLVIEEDRILDAAYKTHGCPSSIASASVLCELVKGREVKLVKTLDDKDLLAVLGGLPAGKGHFATMAIAALQDACGAEAVN